MFAQLCQDFLHGLIQINLDDVPLQVLFGDVREVLCRIGFELFEIHTVFGDLPKDQREGILDASVDDFFKGILRRYKDKIVIATLKADSNKPLINKTVIH